jgi:hypothetical protein
VGGRFPRPRWMCCAPLGRLFDSFLALPSLSTVMAHRRALSSLLAYPRLAGSLRHLSAGSALLHHSALRRQENPAHDIDVSPVHSTLAGIHKGVDILEHHSQASSSFPPTRTQQTSRRRRRWCSVKLSRITCSRSRGRRRRAGGLRGLDRMGR